MEHSFCIEIASIFGIEEAILINNFFYWIKKNEANDKHFHYGRYWTYNTTKALAELFPYMNEKKISRLINNLVEKGIFIKDNFNSSAYDRTCWYAFSDEGISMIKKWGMHFSKMGNGFPEYVQPIPDSNTDNKQEREDTNVSKKEKKTGKFDVRSDLSYVDKEFEDIWMEWLEYKDEIKKQYKTQKGASRQYTTLVNLSDNNPFLAYAIVQRSIEHSWDGVFELSDKQKELYLSDNSPYAKNPKNTKSNIPQDGDVNEKGEVWSQEQQKWLK